MFDIPFLYTTLYAFKLVLTFDERRKIELNDLDNYRNTILERTIEELENDDIYTLLNKLDIEEELFNILDQYSDIFYLKNNILYLNEEITIDDLDSLLTENRLEENLVTRFNHSNYTKEIFNTLKITKVFKWKEKYEKIALEIEKQLEKEYKKENFNSNLIKNLLFKRYYLVSMMHKENEIFMKEYIAIPTDENEIPINENLDYYKNSEYIKNGEPYPIDNELYQNSRYYEDYNEELNPIHQIIEDVYQYAIFGSRNLYKDKYLDDMVKIYIDENFSRDEYEENFSEIELNLNLCDEEFAFYTIYVYKLNELINAGYNEFITTRNRLLYLLDDIEHCLYDNNNFNEFYNLAINYKLEEDSFSFFENEAKYFIEEIFEGKSFKKTEKILFVSTYYKLTKNEEIIDILEEYENYPNYAEIYNFIIDNRKNNLNNKRK